jgi:hypothetical protein
MMDKTEKEAIYKQVDECAITVLAAVEKHNNAVPPFLRKFDDVEFFVPKHVILGEPETEQNKDLYYKVTFSLLALP